MPFGIHKGKTMGEVPGRYLLHIYGFDWLHGKVKKYIEDNQDRILERARLEKKIYSSN
jgi:uncharacterized protein (DUF3820 family)